MLPSSTSRIQQLLAACFLILSLLMSQKGSTQEISPNDFPTGIYLDFDGIRFYLASSVMEPDQFLREYIPERESLDRWNRYMAVIVYPNIPPENTSLFVETMQNSILAENPANRCEVTVDERNGLYLLDFLIWADDGEPTAEWDLMAIAYNEQLGLVVHQYGRRFYFNNPTEEELIQFGLFLKNLREIERAPFAQATFQEMED